MKALGLPRADLRRLRIEHASGADVAAGSPFTDGGNGVAARLAADVRRRGHRLGRRAGHRRRGSGFEGLRRALRHDQGRRKNLDRWEGSELGVHKKIRCRVDRTSSDTTTDPVLAWLYVIDAWEGGIPSARYLGVMADAAEIAGAPSEYVHDLRTRPARNIGPGT